MGASRRRLVRWVIGGGVVGSVVATTFAVLWFMLPRWAPESVIGWSPWLDPMIGAVMHHNDQEGAFMERLDAWGLAIIPALGRSLHSSHPER